MSFFRPHKRISQPVGEESMTKQSHKDECDIHRILKQYQRTGIITHVQSARPTYEDLPDSTDLQEALNTVMAAETAFNALPAQVRDHFKNDPAQFLASFEDEKQHDKLREFGLLKERKPEPPALPKASDLPARDHGQPQP